MKLERLNNSRYNFDSLGEVSFYVQLQQQMSDDVFYYIISYINELQTVTRINNNMMIFLAKTLSNVDVSFNLRNK
jgi:hypothetical protein